MKSFSLSLKEKDLESKKKKCVKLIKRKIKDTELRSPKGKDGRMWQHKPPLQGNTASTRGCELMSCRSNPAQTWLSLLVLKVFWMSCQHFKTGSFPIKIHISSISWRIRRSGILVPSRGMCSPRPAMASEPASLIHIACLACSRCLWWAINKTNKSKRWFRRTCLPHIQGKVNIHYISIRTPPTVQWKNGGKYKQVIHRERNSNSQ